MAILLLIIETFFLWKLYEKYKFSNCFTLVYLIVYFYCNAVLFDIHLLGNREVLTQFYVMLDPGSTAWTMTFFAYFLFLATFFLLFYFGESPPAPSGQAPLKETRFEIANWVVFALTALFFAYALRNSQLDREAVKGQINFGLQTVNVFLTVVFIFVATHTQNKSRLLRRIFILVFCLYCLFRYEREPWIMLLAVGLVSNNNKLRTWHLAVCGATLVVILFYYKPFYRIFLGGHGLDEFAEVASGRTLSLFSLDPYSSFSLVYDYFDKTPFHLSEYDFSYITSFFDQYDRYVNGREIVSLGAAASQKYVDGRYGVAYSMILESILNFSIFGPVVLALLTRGVYFFLSNMFRDVKKVIDVLFVVFFVTFVRTEWMVMIKLYVLPFAISLFVLNLFVRRLRAPAPQTLIST